MKIFVGLLFLYFAILIFNIIVGRIFIKKVKLARNDLWVSWGRPNSVFVFKRKNLEIYRFIFRARRLDFDGNPGLYRIISTMRLATILSQLGFVAALLAFLLAAVVARSN